MLGMNRNGNVALADSPLTLTDLKVNDGNVYPTETPVYVGETVLQDERKNRTRTAVSIDRDWLWIRTADKLIDAHRAWLIKAGFIHAEKRNAWHIDVSVDTLELVSNNLKLGIDVAKWAKHSADVTDAWKKDQEAKQEAKRKTEYQRLSSGRTHVEHKATEANKQAIHEANKAGVSVSTFDKDTMTIDKQGRLRWKSNGQFVDTKGKGKSKHADTTLPEHVEIATLEGGFVERGETTNQSLVDARQRAYDHGLKVGIADRIRGYVKHNDLNEYTGDLAREYTNGYKAGFTPPVSEKDKAIADLQAQMQAMMAKLAELTK